VDVDVLVRISADTGVKPHPRDGRRKAALSATGISSGTFDVEDLLRAESAKALGADEANCDVPVDVAPLTCESSTVADPAFVATT
jgi:hypothetical protein